MNEQTITAMKADWLAFCDQNCKDDYEAIAARVAAPTPKKPARRWIFATSLVAAAAAIALVCLPLLNGHMATSDKMNGGNAPMAPDDGYYENLNGSVNGEDSSGDVDGDMIHGNEDPTDPRPSSSAITTQTTGDKNNGQSGNVTTADKNNGNATTAGTRPTTGMPNGGEQGGDNLAVQSFTNHYKMGTIRNYLLDYAYDTFGSEKFNEIVADIEAAKKADPYTYTGASIHFWVHKLNISKEKFIECNNKDKAFYEEQYKDVEDITDITFTDEEIDDIYNLTTAEFNQKYKAPTAVVAGEVIYPFEWFESNEVDLWLKQSFTVAQLQEAVANAKQTPNFPQSIITEVELKLEKYIFAVG